MNLQAAEALTRARSLLLLDEPFFGALALRLELIEDPAVKTMATNGKYIKYNPDFVNNNSAGLNKAIVAHEVMHCVLDHLSREGAREHKRWNQATDYALNQILEKSGFSFEGTGLLNPAFNEMTADEIYDILPPNPDDGSGNGHGDPLDDMEPGDPDPAAQAEAAREWKVATIQAANAAKLAGKLSAGLERFVDKLVQPKVDWKAELRRFVTERSKNDYSWMRPNRAMMHYDVYLPSMYSESMGEIVVGVDTSGSISAETIAAFCSEVSSIASQVRPSRVHVVYCDSDVNHVDVFNVGEEITMKPYGGGGTRFSPVFDYVTQNDLKPVCLVYLTDLYGDTKFAEPEYPTLWACISNEIAPWGTTIKLE